MPKNCLYELSIVVGVFIGFFWFHFSASFVAKGISCCISWFIYWFLRALDERICYVPEEQVMDRKFFPLSLLALISISTSIVFCSMLEVCF